MLTLVFDTTSSLDIELPETPAEWLELGKAFLASFEDPSRPRPAAPDFNKIEASVKALDAVSKDAGSGEANRSEAAGQRLLLEEKVISRLRKTYRMLKVLHDDNPGILEHWGLEVTQRPRGFTVRTPRSDSDWLEALPVYLAHEANLPPEQRQPHFEELLALSQQLNATQTGQGIGLQQRMSANEIRNQEAARLKPLLQVALAVLLEAQGGAITRKLADHGFTVIERKARKDRSQDLAETTSGV